MLPDGLQQNSHHYVMSCLSAGVEDAMCGNQGGRRPFVREPLETPPITIANEHVDLKWKRLLVRHFWWKTFPKTALNE